MADFSLSIGKIFGIEVDLHWTFLLLLLFILLISLYDFALWILLFVFVLIHELTHSLVARRKGVVVKRIMLYPFGGGSIINPKDLTPQNEITISLSGPIASLLLALGLWAASIFAGPSSSAGQFLGLLALINLLLGIFNILPWLPLDGGRAMRSYLEKKRGHLQATRIAVFYSNITTVIFVIGSIAYELITSNSLAYKAEFILITIAVAMFVYFGAASELSYATLADGIKDLKVKNAISTDYIYANPESDISELKKLWKQNHKKNGSHIVLFKMGKELKVVSIAAMQRALLKNKMADPKVRDFGIRLKSTEWNTPLLDAIDLMNDGDVGILGVSKKGKTIGILLRPRVDYVIGIHLHSTSNAPIGKK